MRSSVTRPLFTSLVCLVAITLWLAPTANSAEETKWSPPDPSQAEKDWILLTSGEWLWGTIDLMRDESLSFDSEELDDLTIDWDKIVEIRSARILTYVMRNGSMVTGTSALKGPTLLITSANGLSEVPRGRIYTILEGEPTELNFWSAKLGADVSIRTGNTNQYDVGTRVSLKREASRSRIDLRYQSNFSERDSVSTVDNQRTSVEWKVFLSRLFFLTPLKAEYLQDAFQNIHGQYTVGVGVGYFIKRSSKLDWYVELSTAKQGTKYNSVLEGEDGSEDHLSIPMKTRLETDISSHIELEVDYSLQLGIGEGTSSSHRSYILLEIDLLGDTDFTASVTWDHVTNPKTNVDGITPNKDDVTMAYGISVNF
ncbi:MAG: hypothetical protein ACI9UK_001229 [Candidatus Krumholzibacteriia bacterium]|jgi:hypothetical protein